MEDSGLKRLQQNAKVMSNIDMWYTDHDAEDATLNDLSQTAQGDSNREDNRN